MVRLNKEYVVKVAANKMREALVERERTMKLIKEVLCFDYDTLMELRDLLEYEITKRRYNQE